LEICKRGIPTHPIPSESESESDGERWASGIWHLGLDGLDLGVRPRGNASSLMQANAPTLLSSIAMDKDPNLKPLADFVSCNPKEGVPTQGQKPPIKCPHGFLPTGINAILQSKMDYKIILIKNKNYFLFTFCSYLC